MDQLLLHSRRNSRVRPRTRHVPKQGCRSNFAVRLFRVSTDPRATYYPRCEAMTLRSVESLESRLLLHAGQEPVVAAALAPIDPANAAVLRVNAGGREFTD